MTDYSLISVVKTLHKWRKHIVYTTGGIAVISIIVSLLVPVYYESSTTFYAASEDLFKPKKVFGYGDSEIEFYGTTSDIQRILTVATSYEISNFLIDTFGLYEHYDVSPERAKAKFIVREKFHSHYNVIRSKYDAIVLTFEDQDPEMAAAVANAARDKINEIIVQTIKGSQVKLIESYERTIATKSGILEGIQDSLQEIQLEYGIFDPEAQTEYLSTLVTETETELVRDRAKLESYKNSRRADQDSIVKLTASIAGLESMLNMLYGLDTINQSQYNIERFTGAKGQIGVLDDEVTKAMNNLNFDKELLKTLESAQALDVTAMHVLEYAEVPLVKSRPRRSLLVAASTLAGFIFIVIGILFIESYRHMDWSFLKEW